MDDDFEESDQLEFSYGDIQRTSYRPPRPTKYKTFEDVFRWDLYQQSKDSPGGLHAIFSPSLIQDCILLLSGHIKLQTRGNPGGLVLGYEYYKRIQAKEISTQVLQELFERGLKIGIQPFDIVRYNRIWFQMLQGENRIQSNPFPYRLSFSSTDSSKVIIEPVNPAKVEIPEFQPLIPSAEPPIEGSITIKIEKLPGQTISFSHPLYAFDSLDQILRTIAFQLQLPVNMLHHSHQLQKHTQSSSKVKEFRISNDKVLSGSPQSTPPLAGSGQMVIGVEIEEEQLSDSITIHPFHLSILTIRPITYYTEDESLTLQETIEAIQSFLILTNHPGILSKALCACYFICFGLLSPQELYSSSTSTHQLWNQFLLLSYEPWNLISAEGRDKRLQAIIRQKFELNQELTLDTTKKLKQLLFEERQIRDELLTLALFISTRDQLKKQYETEQKDRIDFVTSSRQMAYLLSAPKRLKITDLKDTLYTIEGTFTMEGYDSYELFNQIQVSMEIPFCTVGSFHKVLNGIVLPPNWIADQQHEDVNFYIRTKTLPQQLYSIIRSDTIYPELYSRVSISTVETKKQLIDGKEAYINSFKVLIQAENSVDQYEVIQKFLSCFQTPPMDLKVRKLFGEGEYVLVGLNFSEQILHDYAFNDPLVREFMFMNEHSSMYTIRLRYKFYLGEELSGSIRSHVVEKAVDPAIRSFPADVNVGDTIYTISLKRIKDISVKEVQLRKRYFDACLQYLIDTYHSRFLSWYTRHIVNIRDIASVKFLKPKHTLKQLTNKLINPGLFRSNYSREGCSHPPIIISEEDAKRTKDRLKFPKDSDVTDERPQFWYKCADPVYKYPSLKINTMSFKDKKETERYHQLYPFIPCCLEVNQSIEGTLYDSYEKNDKNTLDTPIYVGEKEDTRSKTILKRDTALRPKQLGELPRSIRNLLVFNQEDILTGKQNIVRFGIPSTRQGTSFLTACCTAFYFQELLKSPNFRDMLAQKENTLIQQLLDLVNTQQNAQSGLSSEQLRRILHQRLFVNPKDWILLVQQIMRVNIVVCYYDKTEDGQEVAELLTPSYYRFFILSSPHLMPYDHTIFLYNAPDNLSYLPRHTEPIILIQQTKLVTALFSSKPALRPLIQGTITIIQQTISLPPSVQVLSQKPDAYGKIREVTFLYNNQSIILHCSPIAPLPIQSSNTTKSNTLTQTPQAIQQLLIQLKTSLFIVNSPRHPDKAIGFAGIYKSSQHEGHLGLFRDSREGHLGLFRDSREGHLGLFRDSREGHLGLFRDSREGHLGLVRDSREGHVEWFGEFDQEIDISLLPSYPKWNMTCHSYLAPISSRVPTELTFFEKYSNFTRQANCLLSYLFFLFSSLFYKEVDLFEAARFFEDRHIILIPTHQYIVKDRSLFLEQSHFIHQSKQLVVPDETIKERLMYNLRLQIQYNESFVRDYHLKKYIPQFYTNAKDFDSSDLYTIYYTYKEYIASRHQQKMVYQVLSAPSPSLEAFYLQHPDLFDNQRCIARKLLEDSDKESIFGLMQPFYLYTVESSPSIIYKRQTVLLQQSISNQPPILIPSSIPVSPNQPALVLIRYLNQPYTYLVQKDLNFNTCL